MAPRYSCPKLLSLPFLLLPTFLALPVLAQNNCYQANGIDQNAQWGGSGSEYSRCGGKSEHSMCCRWNTDVSPDTCRSDGLCANNYSVLLLWRESCTDPTWEDEGCLKLCYKGTGQVKANDDKFYELGTMNVQVTRCGNGSYCCGERGSIMATDCCDNGEGVWIVDGKKIVSEDPSKPKSTTSSTTSTAASTISDSAPSASTTSPQFADSHPKPSSSTNIGAIVGAVVGVVVGLALIGGLIWFLIMRRKKRNLYAPAQLHGDSLSEVDATTIKYAHYGVNELSGRETVNEISESRSVHEIGAHRPHAAELEGCAVPILENSSKMPRS